MMRTYFPCKRHHRQVHCMNREYSCIAIATLSQAHRRLLALHAMPEHSKDHYSATVKPSVLKFI